MSRILRQIAQRARPGILRAAGLWLLLLLAPPALAAPYTAAELESEKQRLAPLIRTAFRELRAAVPEFDQFRAAELLLSVPLDGPSPIYFGNRPDTQTVVIPVESVRFLEDFVQLEAIFERRGCDRGWLQAYAWALLADGRDLPPPLRAFGITADTAADDLGARLAASDLLGPTLQFLIAHEMGHLLRGDTRGPAEPHSLAEELGADRFALDRAAGFRIRPESLDTVFLLERWRDPGGAQTGGGKHPVSPERLQAIADRLLLDRDMFRSFRSGELGQVQVEMLAYDLSGMGRLMDSARLVRPLEGLLSDYPPSQMALACPE
ncbi:M48 family metalloprotease [Mangrovicoccus ximenensis]|uniref:hypothetical protein n=1 Tax=Mangrovicoccus ximenensis TaxID=1911570 RepID=UPI000D39E552|nr:hypothetical protein [Mangrovicoccus ximenensis]